jgi:hypothetical protein
MMMKILDSMIGYWTALLLVSLGIAAAIYMIWLRGYM